MIKISVNLNEEDARTIDDLKAGRNISKSELIRTAIHEYCVKADAEQSCVHEAIDAAYGVCKESPIDADAVRVDSNESGRT
jgi:metal-responsive CopG/Arc/MetJ family transcriptional regulator